MNLPRASDRGCLYNQTANKRAKLWPPIVDKLPEWTSVEVAHGQDIKKSVLKRMWKVNGFHCLIRSSWESKQKENKCLLTEAPELGDFAFCSGHDREMAEFPWGARAFLSSRVFWSWFRCFRGKEMNRYWVSFICHSCHENTQNIVLLNDLQCFNAYSIIPHSNPNL